MLILAPLSEKLTRLIQNPLTFKTTMADFMTFANIESVPKNYRNMFLKTGLVKIKFDLPHYFDEAPVFIMIEVSEVKKLYRMIKDEDETAGFNDFLIWTSMEELTKYKGRASQINRESEEWTHFVDIFMTLRLLKMVIRNDPIPFFLK